MAGLDKTSKKQVISKTSNQSKAWSYDQNAKIWKILPKRKNKKIIKTIKNGKNIEKTKNIRHRKTWKISKIIKIMKSIEKYQKKEKYKKHKKKYWKYRSRKGGWGKPLATRTRTHPKPVKWSLWPSSITTQHLTASPTRCFGWPICIDYSWARLSVWRNNIRQLLTDDVWVNGCFPRRSQ